MKLLGLDSLGSGYDVLDGSYADSGSCMGQLFGFPADENIVQIGNKEFNKPSCVIYHSILETLVSTVSGKSMEEYTTNINSKTKLEGNYGFFSASVEADIGKSTSNTSDCIFTKVQSTLQYFSLQLPFEHKDMLNPKVKEDIEKMEDISELFGKYGTHSLASLVMGGSAFYTSTTNTTEFQSKFDVRVVAEMAFKAAIGGLSAQEEAQYGNSIKKFHESSSSTFKSKGGKPGLQFPAQMTEWNDSVEDYMAFVDFLGERSLVGIWKLASSPERKDEIHNFYHSYCKGKMKLPLLRTTVIPFVTSSSELDSVAVWAPGLQDWYFESTGGDWYYLGQVWYDLGPWNSFPPSHTLVVQEIRAGMLADVDHWVNVLTGEGFSIWRGISGSENYVVLGDFYHSKTGPPTAEETAGIKAVHIDCVMRGALGRYYKLRGSHILNKLNVRPILPIPGEQDKAVALDDAQSLFSLETSDPVYVLRKSVLDLDTSMYITTV